ALPRAAGEIAPRTLFRVVDHALYGVVYVPHVSLLHAPDSAGRGHDAHAVAVQHIDGAADAAGEQPIPDGGLEPQGLAAELQRAVGLDAVEMLARHHRAVAALRRVADQRRELRHARHEDAHARGRPVRTRQPRLQQRRLARPDLVDLPDAAAR